MESFEYAIVEWLWDNELIKVYFPNHTEEQFEGSYSKTADVLSELGKQGWEVATTTAGGNWILWTLKRMV